MSETVSDGSVVARPGRIFTPEIPAEARYPGERLNDGRAVMWLDPADVEKITGWRKGQWVEITDRNTDTRWRVTPAPCGADCYCAAFAEPLDPAMTEQQWQIHDAAERLLAVLADVVPRTTAHYAVEQARRAVRTLRDENQRRPVVTKDAAS